MVGPNKERIVKYSSKLLKEKTEYLDMSKEISTYGDGNASKRIVELLSKMGLKC